MAKNTNVVTTNTKAEDVNKIIPLDQQNAQEVIEDSEKDVERENQIVILEGEIVKLQDELAEKRKQLRALNKKDKVGESKMDLCVQYYKDHPGLERKDYLKGFVDHCGMTKAGAQTYYAIIKGKEKSAK